MKNLISILFLITGLMGVSQTNISTNDLVDATTTSCTSATHISIYYPKVQKHFSDSTALGNISAEQLYLDARTKGAIVKGYLDIEVAFMESNNFVCQVKKYKILTPDYFELTKRNYCVNEVANFAKHRVNYDGNEIIYILDSSLNYIDTGAVYTPLYAGKYYLEYSNSVAGLNYLDSITVNPQPSIAFSNPIPNNFNSVRPLDKFNLNSHITHTGARLESSSPGVILESGNLVLNVEFVGKYHNIMKYTSVSGKGCSNSLIDTVFIDDNLNSNSPTPLLNDPTHSGTYVTSTNTLASIPMCLQREECDGTSLSIVNRSPFLYDTNYTYEWFMISENILTNLGSTGSGHVLTIPSNNKNDIIQVMSRVIHKTTNDTSLFFNQIIQTHKNYIRTFESCSLLGDSTKVEINSKALESDFNNFYWKSGVFDTSSYNLGSTLHYYKPSGPFIFNAKHIINENTNKTNSYNIEYSTTVPSYENTKQMYIYSGINNLPSSSAVYAPSVTTNCYTYDTVELILPPTVDISYNATLNGSGLVPLGSPISHTVNNTSIGSSYTLNYFTDTLSGANGSYNTTKSGYNHSAYRITDSYGCIADSTFYNLFNVDFPLGIETLSELDVKVFPNPFTDYITIETEKIENANIRIYNIYGGLVFQSTKNIFGSKTIKVPSNLPKGTYVINVIGSKKGFTKRITKI